MLYYNQSVVVLPHVKNSIFFLRWHLSFQGCQCRLAFFWNDTAISVPKQNVWPCHLQSIHMLIYIYKTWTYKYICMCMYINIHIQCIYIYIYTYGFGYGFISFDSWYGFWVYPGKKSFAFKLSMHSEKSKGGHVGHIGVYRKKNINEWINTCNYVCMSIYLYIRQGPTT